MPCQPKNLLRRAASGEMALATCQSWPCGQPLSPRAPRPGTPVALRGLPWWRGPAGSNTKLLRSTDSRWTRDSFADALAEPYWVSPAIVLLRESWRAVRGMGRVGEIDPGMRQASVVGGSSVRPGSMGIGYAGGSGSHNGVPFFFSPILN